MYGLYSPIMSFNIAAKFASKIQISTKTKNRHRTYTTNIIFMMCLYTTYNICKVCLPATNTKIHIHAHKKRDACAHINCEFKFSKHARASAYNSIKYSSCCVFILLFPACAICDLRKGRTISSCMFWCVCERECVVNIMLSSRASLPRRICVGGDCEDANDDDDDDYLDGYCFFAIWHIR